MSKEKASQPENLDAKAQQLLEEKESEARMRTYTGPMAKILVLLLCVWTAFQLYFTTLGAISTINLRAVHCIFLLLFTFLLLSKNIRVFFRILPVSFLTLFNKIFPIIA